MNPASMVVFGLVFSSLGYLPKLAEGDEFAVEKHLSTKVGWLKDALGWSQSISCSSIYPSLTTPCVVLNAPELPPGHQPSLSELKHTHTLVKYNSRHEALITFHCDSPQTGYANCTPPEGGVPLISLANPDSAQPVFIYLLSRHGSRYPTNGKMRVGAGLSPLILRSETKAFQTWRYLFSGEQHLAGQLHRIGAHELTGLGERYAKRFPSLFKPAWDLAPYPSTTMLVRSTQKPRCSASAAAFMRGATDLAYSLTMEPLDQDPRLRFFDVCPAYEEFKDAVGDCLSSVKNEVWSPMVQSVSDGLQLGGGGVIEPAQVGDLWILCQQEAMLGHMDWACSLFTPEQVLLLEWLDDLVVLEEKAHGACLPYQMAAPLLNDTMQHVRQAAQDTIDGGAPIQRAVLNFAHAETVVPYASLLKMFGSPGQCELDSCGTKSGAGAVCHNTGYEPLLPKPPAKRVFRGAVVSPYGANVAHVLFHRPGTGEQFVWTIYNEHVVPLPGCGGRLECPLETFLGLEANVAGSNELKEACAAWSACKTEL